MVTCGKHLYIYVSSPVPNFLLGCPGRLHAFWTCVKRQVSTCRFLAFSESMNMENTVYFMG